MLGQTDEDHGGIVREEDRRLESERAFHNERYGTEADVRDPLNKWYAAIGAGARLHVEMIKRYAHDAQVLEYGCADGRLSLIEFCIAQDARNYWGIDISDQAILRARQTAEELGLTHCEFQTMDAQAMTFPDNKFDLLFGRGIIHHLELHKCFPEIARVLRPGGRAIFYEPMGHNPAINGFRNKTPHLRTPDEHPLLVDDFRLAKNYFKGVDCTYYGLTTLAAVPFSDTAIGGPMLSAFEGLDRLLLRIPYLRQQAWHVLLVLTK